MPKLIDQARDRAFWKDLNPHLKISNEVGEFASRIRVDQKVIEEAKADIRTQGYLQIPKLLPEKHLEALAKGVEAVTAAGWPTAFAFVYDNYWEIYQSLEPVLSFILGPGYILSPQIWVWHVKPNTGSSGWSGHRDRPEVETVLPDGSPKTMTTWLPLTDATTLNGCIYVLPAHLDPHYAADQHDFEVRDLQDVRALPAERGSMLAWTESLFHWGSRSSDKAKAPRISIANTFQRGDMPLFDTPRLDPRKLLSFDERLGLIGQNVLWHQQRYHNKAEIVAVCEKLCRYFPPIQFLDTRDQRTLEIDQRLSESVLWSLQEKHISRMGLNAGEETAWQTISSGPFCETYAELLLSFLHDYQSKLDFNYPLHIVELGGGTGFFAYRFLNELTEKIKDFEKFRGLKLRYVLANFATAVVDSWRKNKRLSEHQQSGILDFAVYQGEKGDENKLQGPAGVLNDQTLKNPLIVIANNIFGAIKQDAFRFQHGDMQEIRSTRFLDTLDTPVEAELIRNIERYFDVDGNYYNDSDLDGILEYYRRTVDDAKVIFPIGALRCIRSLIKLSHNNLVVLASDRGLGRCAPDKALRFQEPEFAVRDGRFSFAVNFDAIGRYVEKLGGTTLMNEGGDGRVCTTISILLSQKSEKLEHVKHYFNQQLIRRDSINSSSFTQDQISRFPVEAGAALPWTKRFLAIVRASSFEPLAFSIAYDQTAEHMKEEVNSLDDKTMADLLAVLKQIARNIFSVDGALRCLFEFYVQINRFDDCLRLGQEMLTVFGPHQAIFDHIALSYEALGQFDLAYEYFQKSSDLAPGHDWAKEGAMRTKNRINQARVPR